MAVLLWWWVLMIIRCPRITNPSRSCLLTCCRWLVSEPSSRSSEASSGLCVTPFGRLWLTLIGRVRCWSWWTEQWTVKLIAMLLDEKRRSSPRSLTNHFRLYCVCLCVRRMVDRLCVCVIISVILMWVQLCCGFCGCISFKAETFSQWQKM